MRRPRLLLPTAVTSAAAIAWIHSTTNSRRPLDGSGRGQRGFVDRAEGSQSTWTRTSPSLLVSSSVNTAPRTVWSHLLAGPLTRVTLSEIAMSCLSQEGKHLYAVYKPHAPTSGRPEDFTKLIHALVDAGLVEPHGRRVAELYLELLQKPLHPQQGILTPWDLSPADITAAEIHVIETIMAASDPASALTWLGERVLGDISARQPDVTEGTHGRFTIARFMLDTYLLPLPHGAVDFCPRATRLLLTRQLVAAVTSALFRTGNVTDKHEAMQLLEQAALSRLTGRFQHATLFDEHVAVQCAEAAATVGDSETVARLMFLLYRTRGALGSTSLYDHAKREVNAGRAVATILSPSTSGSVREGKLSPSPALRHWWGSLWSFQRPQGPSNDQKKGEEPLFEAAAIRLLKSTIRAALYNGPGGAPGGMETIGGSAQLYDAYALFDALRPGTTWAGAAGMAVELLLFISARQQGVFASLWQPTTLATATSVEVSSSATIDMQRCALRVLHSVLRDASRCAPSEAVRHDVVAYCVRLAMEAFTYVAPLHKEHGHETQCASVAHTGGAGAAIPVFVMPNSDDNVAAAEIVLSLFSLVTKHRHQKQLLPFALGSAATLFQVVARDGSLTKTPARDRVSTGVLVTLVETLFPACSREAASPLSSLLSFFTNVESPAYCVAAISPGTTLTTTVAAGALILYLSLLLTPSHQGCDATAPLAHRLCSNGGASDGASSCMQPEWFSIAASPQRAVLWSLLKFLETVRQSSLAPPSLQRQLFMGPRSQAALLRAAHAVAARRDCTADELGKLVHCTYVNGVQKIDGDSGPAPDPLLTRYLGFTVLSYSVRALAKELAEGVAAPSVSAPQVVVFVASATLDGVRSGVGIDAMLMRSISSSAAASVDYLAHFVDNIIRPLVTTYHHPPTHRNAQADQSRSPDLFVTFVVSGQALHKLRSVAKYTDTEEGPASSGGRTLAAALLRSLAETVPRLVHSGASVEDHRCDTKSAPAHSPPYRVLVASPAPLPPSRSSENQRHLAQILPANRDGVLEARELGRAIADIAPHAFSPTSSRSTQRVQLYFWNEAVASPASDDVAEENEAAALQHLMELHHVQLLSVRRAQVEKTKRDIRLLMRAAATPNRPFTAHSRPLTPPKKAASQHL